MKTRLVAFSHRGSAAVDPHFSAAMLPWTINDIRSIGTYNKLSIGIENGNLEAYNSDFELQFSHPLKHLIGMCRIVQQQVTSRSNGNDFAQFKISHLTASTPSARNQLYNATTFSKGGKNNPQSGSGSGNTSVGHNTSKGMLSSMRVSQSHGSLSLFSGQEANQQQSISNDLLQPQHHTSINSSNYLRIPNGNQDSIEIIGPQPGLVYMIRNPKDSLIHIHLYESDSANEMDELIRQMRNPAHTLGGSVGSIPHTLMTLVHSENGQMSTMAKPANTKSSTNSHRMSYPRMKSSKSYTHGLSGSIGMMSVASSASAHSNLSLLSEISPNHTHFFEVMYVGKIRVSYKRVPYTFIDDALPKFRAYDIQRARLLEAVNNNNYNAQEPIDMVKEECSPSGASTLDEIKPSLTRSPSRDEEDDAAETLSTISIYSNNNKENKSPSMASQAQIYAKLKHGNNDGGIILETANGKVAKNGEKNKSEQIFNNLPQLQEDNLLHGAGSSLHQLANKIQQQNEQRSRSSSYGCLPPYLELNRTMVFLVGRSDLRLISPDRKQLLLYKDLKDVASCAQGQNNADHFGIICREALTDGYISYVFKCQSDHVCDDIVSAISQAFLICAEQKSKESLRQAQLPVISCDNCPMLWYHKLCIDVASLGEKKTQQTIFKRIETLTDSEKHTIWAKFYGSEKINASLVDQNQFLMMLLRAHCEAHQQQHHIHDITENRNEFLNQYLTGNTIFMKAKRSLTNSFDHLLKRKPSKDDMSLNSVSNTVSLTASSSCALSPSAEVQKADKNIAGTSSSVGSGLGDDQRSARQASNTSANGLHHLTIVESTLKSPMIDIFLKVGNNPREVSNEAHLGSWRHAILNKVAVNPIKCLGDADDAKYLENSVIIGQRSGEELRDLWKTAIRQTILLNRMETENAILQIRQNQNELKRIKLDYDEIVVYDKQVLDKWEKEFTSLEKSDSKFNLKVNLPLHTDLCKLIELGIPKAKRGDLWFLLSEQYMIRTESKKKFEDDAQRFPPVDLNRFPNFYTPYTTLLKNLTEHQHAIFIDLGRTFPNHKYYKDPLGLGQLSLFNLLKAYSILDPELGYCQGLGFICGVLLLHCDEAEAFYLLKHLMFHREMRSKYLPDMRKFQLQLYQLSRLIKDYLPDLYLWFDQNDVSPTLYAAPWILTVFSSQFSLGFVARIFDLLFLDDTNVIFKFALALLNFHHKNLLQCENFEAIMDYLKNTLPKIDVNTMDKIIEMVHKVDIKDELIEYNVEYNVLQEEILAENQQFEKLKKEKSHNLCLNQQLQCAQSRIVQLEKVCGSQQQQIDTLQNEVRYLNTNLQTLGKFLNSLVTKNSSEVIVIPPAVRSILRQLEQMKKQRPNKIPKTESKLTKSISMNSQLGFSVNTLEEEMPESDENEKLHLFINGDHEMVAHDSIEYVASVLPEKSSRPNTLPYNTNASGPDAKFYAHSPTQVDSGMGTPLSSPLNHNIATINASTY